MTWTLYTMTWWRGSTFGGQKVGRGVTIHGMKQNQQKAHENQTNPYSKWRMSWRVDQSVFFLSSFFVKGVQKWYCKEGRSSPHPYCRRRHVKQGSNICVSIYNVLAPLPCVNIDFYIYFLLFGHRLKHIRLQNKRLKIMIVLECVWNSNTLRLRATSHTRLRALDRCTSSTPVGERGRAGASSLRTKHYRPTE